MESLKEGLSFERKREWYSALRGADALIQDGELATFRRLVCEAPCRYDPAFQWRVCQLLGEMAANPKWDVVTHRNAIALLGEIYRNDEVWGKRVSVKQWILNILMQLSATSGEAPQCKLNRLPTDSSWKFHIYYDFCNGLTIHTFICAHSSTFCSCRNTSPRIGSKQRHQEAGSLSKMSGEWPC